MKQFLCAVVALVLAASVFAGCGCTNRNVSNRPDGMITNPTTVPPTTNPLPTMTTPTTETTMPHPTVTEPGPEMTEGPMDTQPGTGDTGTTGETDPSDHSRSRNRMPGR